MVRTTVKGGSYEKGVLAVTTGAMNVNFRRLALKVFHYQVKITTKEADGHNNGIGWPTAKLSSHGGHFPQV
jgi:hypothetical protein